MSKPIATLSYPTGRRRADLAVTRVRRARARFMRRTARSTRIVSTASASSLLPAVFVNTGHIVSTSRARKAFSRRITGLRSAPKQVGAGKLSPSSDCARDKGDIVLSALGFSCRPKTTAAFRLPGKGRGVQGGHAPDARANSSAPGLNWAFALAPSRPCCGAAAHCRARSGGRRGA